MAKTPMQFQVPEKFREEIETYAKNNDISLSELLRQSARIYILLRSYMDKGYEVVLRKKDGGSEKEIILP